MKHKNVRVGQKVKVEESTQHNYHRISGVGNVIYVEPLGCDDVLNVRVQFSEDDKDGCNFHWFNHKDIRLVKDSEE